MNSTERLHNRLKDQLVDRPPNVNIMMTFAAHFIGQPLSAYYQNYRVLCDANLAVREAFGLDILQAISDPYREAADFGLVVDFPEDGLPVAKTPLLENPAGLANLRVIKPENGQRMSDRIAGVRAMKEAAGGEIPVMGWVEGAMAEAADLRGVSNVMTDIYDRREWLVELLEKTVTVAITFAQAQVEAGADIIGLGDAIASQVSPRIYRELALPYEKRVFDAVHEMGALARLHICGDTTRIVHDMPLSGADIIDIDWMVDMGLAAEAFGPNVSVCGNADPVAVMLQGTPEEVYAATQECMSLGGPRAISAGGCEIAMGTPIANLNAQIQALADWGAR